MKIEASLNLWYTTNLYAEQYATFCFRSGLDRSFISYIYPGPINQSINQSIQTDSLRLNTDNSTRFSATQLIVPASLITVGTLGLCNGFIKDTNNCIRNNLAEARGDNYCHIDDYLQYLPVVSYVGMDFIGIEARHNAKSRLLVTATSYLTMGILVNVVKKTVNSPRPDTGAKNSFPSGHSATAFMGAELVRMEYGTAPAIGAYAVACGVGFMRLWNDRHWLTDVLAGAGTGILSARVGYWMLPVWQKLFHLEDSGMAISIAPIYNHADRQLGASMAMTF